MNFKKRNEPHPEPICSCGHGRKQHSRNGCTSCSCPVKYMDLRP